MSYEKEEWVEERQFNVVQERIILVEYVVEASSMSDAVAQIESGDHSGVIYEDAGDSTAHGAGRIVSAKVNDDD